MRRLLACFLVLSSLPFAVRAAPADKERRATRDAKLSKKDATVLDKSLAGDITRKKEESTAVPLQYDQFRLGVELQVADKRREQIQSLNKIIGYGGGTDPKEMPSLLFRLGELEWEESKYYFFEANRKDDELIAAMNAKDPAAQARAKKEKTDLLLRRDQHAKIAMDQYSTIVQKYKDYERTDEVLYLLGHNLLESGDDRKALVAYKRLIDKFPKSKYVPDAYLSFGEYYFNNSKGRREMLDKALENYKKAAAFPENQVYGFALYKQGWCYFNLNDYPKAMDMWRAVILYGEFAGAQALEKDGGKGGKNTLIREARNDYVRAYSRFGTPGEARENFSKVASKPDDRFLMMKQLANLYYDDGKDREAAVTFDMLIKEKPLSPDAPGFQGKIVDCVLRAGNKKMTVSQVRRLVRIMQDVEKSGVIKEEADKKTLVKAKDLSERTLSNLAVNWHNEAKKTRDDETFGYANEVYSDYLTLFPDNPKAYDLRFFWAELLNDNLQKYDKAANEYTAVVMQDGKRIDGEKGADGQYKVKPGKPGKWLVNAAYNAVLANDEVVKKAEEKGEIKPVDTTGDLKKPAQMPALKQALLDSCERYLKYLPKGDKRVEISFKAARLYYSYRHYDEAIKRFSQIALNYPDYKFENGDRGGEIAANLVLDSYNGLGDFAKVNEWARKFYANDKLATGPFRAELSKVIEQSSFKLVNALEEKKQFAKAAEEYLKFVQDFPKTEIADTAIFNASTDYFKAHQLDKAMETRSRLIRTYPRSKLVPASIFANAEGHEAIGEFEASAENYEAYAHGYERSLGAVDHAKKKGHHKSRRVEAARSDKKDEAVQVWEEGKAQTALLNAGIYRDGLGQSKAALKDREKFMDLWPESKESEAVFLSIADLHEKNGSTGREIAQLEQYEKDNQRDPEKVLTAEGRIMALYQKHQPRRIYGMNKRVLEYYAKLYPRQKKALSPTALDPVARATLAKDEEQLAFFSHEKLHWGRMPNPIKDFKASIKTKSDSLKEVEKLYVQVVNMKAPDPAICALYKIGTAYQNMADSVANAPVPKFVPPDVADALREQLGQQAKPVSDKAAEAFAAAVSKSRELNAYNDCSTKALKILRDGLRPEQFPQMQEDVVDLKPGASTHSQARGSDLVASIQPAIASVNLLDPPKPNLTLSAPKKGDGAETHSDARPSEGKEDDLSDLGEGMKPTSTSTSSTGDADRLPAKPVTPSKPAKSAADEPEDSL